MTTRVQNDSLYFLTRFGRLCRRISIPFAAFSAVFLAFIAAQVAVGQRPDGVINVKTELISFEIIVSDKDGRPVNDLDPNDLVVLVNGVERKIDFFQPLYDRSHKRPLVIVFALDISGSMTAAELERLRSAMAEFVGRLSAENAYFSLVTFSMDVKTIQKFTNRPADIRRSFEKISKDRFGLSTHAYDAVDHSIRHIGRNAPRSIRGALPKKAVVVISDGFPVGDVVSSATVIERAQMADVSVYSVIMPSYSRLQGNRRPLMTPFEASGLTERTGGRSLYAGEQNLEPLFNALAEQIASSYVVAFYPDENVENKSFQKVEIRSRKDLTVKQNRTGYSPVP